MTKSADAFRTISEVSDWLDTPAHVLRFWESKFREIAPVKRAGGRRYYRPTDMALLGGIKKLLHEDGMTIKGVQKVLREQGVDHVAKLAPDLGLGDTAPVVDLHPAPQTPDIPADPADDSARAAARAFGKLVARDTKSLKAKAKRIAPLAARLAAIHPAK